MPSFYQVPTESITGDVFSVEVNGAPLAFEKDLHKNTMTLLLPLANWLEIKTENYRRKPDLCGAIYARLAWTTEEAALERWPVLAGFKDAAAAAGDDIKQLRVIYQSMNGLLGDIMDETPEFYAHANRIWRGVCDRISAISDAERAAAAEAIAPPAWWNHSSESAARPCWKLSLEFDEMDHDGYCSGAEEDEAFVSQTRKQTLYVPSVNDAGAPWSFEKKSWKGDPSCSGGCGCCGISEKVRLVGVERLPEILEGVE